MRGMEHAGQDQLTLLEVVGQGKNGPMPSRKPMRFISLQMLEPIVKGDGFIAALPID